ncbi:proline--tRNA ligase [Candidatus Uhrbacteria bacterium]|nr:proline--tRNA ligase [Candidatus Uhrbacteria bacterium]
MAYEKKDLPKKSDSLSEWYNKIVLSSELADYGPAKGTMIFRPYGYAIWELVQKEMDAMIKDRGVENAYFPMFIPEGLLHKEQEHVEGFSPELAVVTIGGGEELKEKLVVRPTSETIMYDAYSRWVHSWRDLPMLINQWNNVVRWEKRTYLFLRTTEFLWQEGHTAHATHEEALETVHWAMNMYQKIYRELFALPGYIGRKSESEKFAGADMTLTYETLMPEGKALQSCTSHDLGQNFSKPFNINFQNKDGQAEFVWQTSWGLSTRSIGGLIMAHGDDQGLRLPPRLAPIQVVVIPVRPEPELLDYAREVVATLQKAGVRTKLDDRDSETMGFKINKWELKGVPVRLEIGKREREGKNVMYARRDTGAKNTIAVDDLAVAILKLLDEVQASLFGQAERFLQDNTHTADNWEEFVTMMEGGRGFVRARWCERAQCEAHIKEKTKATTRCLQNDALPEQGGCIHCGQKAEKRWTFAVAY